MRNDGDSSSSKISLTDQPVEVLPGIKAWRNPSNGFVVAMVHYTADPNSANEEQRRQGMSEEDYKREHDLDFTSYAGKPVYRMFEDKRHSGGDNEVFIAPKELKVPLWRGWDFGYHHPAVVYAQVHGGFWVLGELLGEDMTLEQFVTKVVLPYEARVFGEDQKFLDAADPAGRQITDKSEHTSFAILANHGIFPIARKSEINEGLVLIREKLTEGTFKVHQRCPITIEGMKGGYRYPDPTKGMPEPLFPLKDGYFDHVMDALRYIAVNALSVRVPKPKKPEENLPPLVAKVLASKVRHRDPDMGDYY